MQTLPAPRTHRGTCRASRAAFAGLVISLCMIAGGQTRAHAAFPGHNGTILFLRAHVRPHAKYATRVDVFVMNADGTHAHELLRDAFDASYSPDGRSIAYLEGSGYRNAVAVARADGTHRRRLTPFGGHGSPRFTPSGREVVYTVTQSPPRSFFFDIRPNVRSTLEVTAVSSGRSRRVLRLAGVVDEIGVMPTSGRLFVLRSVHPHAHSPYGSEFFSVRLDGHDRRIYFGVSYFLFGLDVSPDGTAIALATDQLVTYPLTGLFISGILPTRLEPFSNPDGGYPGIYPAVVSGRVAGSIGAEGSV